MAKEPKTSPVSVTRSVVLPVDVDERLQKLAVKTERTMSWLIAKATREMLDRDEKPKK